MNKSEVFKPTLGQDKKTNKKVEEKEIDQTKEQVDILRKLTEFKALTAVNEKEASEITIKYLKPNFFRKLIKKDSKVFLVYPLTMSQSVEVAKRLLLMPDIDLRELDEYQMLTKSIEYATKENVINLSEIISIFLDGKVKAKTINFIYENLNFSEIKDIVTKIILNGGFVDFTTTTLLIQNKMQLKTAAK